MPDSVLFMSRDEVLIVPNSVEIFIDKYLPEMSKVVIDVGYGIDSGAIFINENHLVEILQNCIGCIVYRWNFNIIY